MENLNCKACTSEINYCVLENYPSRGKALPCDLIRSNNTITKMMLMPLILDFQEPML